MRTSKYAIFRYWFLDDDGKSLKHNGQLEVLEELRGQKAPYRARDPQPDDFKNFIFDVEEKEINGYKYISFGIGYIVEFRVERRLNRDTEKVEVAMVESDDLRSTRAVLVPRFGVSAFKDGSGDQVSATGGAGRTSAIVAMYTEGAAEFEETASQQDVDQAMERLRLVEMTFDVRPFNPHPSVPGDMLHELLQKANVGKMSAKTTPHPGGGLTTDEEGIVSEARGMSAKGYGHFGIKAETEAGAQVSYKKPPLRGEVDKDLTAEEKPKLLRIAVEKSEVDEEEETAIVEAMIEIFGDPQA